MAQSDQAQFQPTKLKSALLGLIGTAAGSFLPGVVATAVLVFVFGNYGKLGPVGELMVSALIFAFFTAATVVGCLIGLLPLWYAARVRKPLHAFWLAVAASLLSVTGFMTGVSLGLSRKVAEMMNLASQQENVLVVVVTVLHLIVFSIVCVVYGQFEGRSR